MKIAFLITAYVDPSQLARVIYALKTPEHDFYIHIDAKVDAKEFVEKVYKKNGRENIWFVSEDERVRVYWGGYSQIQSQLSLMKMVVESEKKYERIVNMTGTDYPLWSNKRIENYFIENKQTQFIMGYNFERATNPIRKYKVERYWFFDWRKYPGFRHIESPVRHVANLFSSQKRNKMKETGYKFYYGSEYWALTQDCLEYVYEKYTKDIKLQRLMKTSFVPSEIYVQTILYNSKYVNDLFGEPEYNVDRVSRLAPLHYFLYEERIQEFDEKDLPMLEFFDKMFFRKARTGISDKLMNIIDNRRKQEDEVL